MWSRSIVLKKASTQSHCSEKGFNAEILCCESTPNWYELPMMMRVKGLAGFQDTVGKVE